ncbi:4-hydroxy-tetrahydrodipicolinate synthase [Salisediminibacterium halotolerans]|uniref:4-hydroxy-tetrahydrodipicolinate synthase n=1 Tax=Salisediminibacterium halotolerans TaxID=517425 RepID=A0A1H9RPN1_9BACI|nr:4-hydroxy-tetrahydrodipicolinate synthase [Salisediminibacterium haloalkalitolerans]SER73849.1 4-hydroxy-tetrahydrodipicolinate synthase [Salisediminibacterium haloalkalitolerans]
MYFGSLITAMITPFHEDGTLNTDACERMIEHLISEGSDAIVVAGTTGEAPTLSIDEKSRLFRLAADKAAGRAYIIAGTGTNSTQAAVQLSEQAETAGVDAVMLTAPYYNKPNQKGMYEHFRTIAEAIDLPVMLYNIPGRTGVNMTADLTVSLAEIENIVSVKEASGDLDQMSNIIERTSADFSVYAGDDSLTLPAMAVGADGIVSISSHVIGREMKEMITAFAGGEHQQASRLHRRLLLFMQHMFIAPSPAPVKAALNLIDFPAGPVRLPMTELDSQDRENVRNVTADLGKLH